MSTVHARVTLEDALRDCIYHLFLMIHRVVFVVFRSSPRPTLAAPSFRLDFVSHGFSFNLPLRYIQKYCTAGKNINTLWAYPYSPPAAYQASPLLGKNCFPHWTHKRLVTVVRGWDGRSPNFCLLLYFFFSFCNGEN